jgi:hypothetical protein
MSGFRVDRVEGGWVLRELHQDKKDKRKIIVVGEGTPDTWLSTALKQFINHTIKCYEKTTK